MKKLLLLSILFIITNCTPLPLRNVHYLIYSVNGDGEYIEVSVTLNNQGGNTEQYSSKMTPYSYYLKAKKGQFLYISGQVGAGGDPRTTITANIYVDDELIETSRSQGEYVIATASGRCP